MPNDISIVQSKLIGISCLDSRERQHAMQEWEERFHEHDAFWVDAKAGQSATSLAQSIAGMLRDQEITAVGGQSLVLAVFLDLTKTPDTALLEEILKVPKVLSHALGCVVPLTMEFGFVGELAFGDADLLKSNVRQVVQRNCADTLQRKQLCLVGVSPLWQPDEDISWKSVMVCLDLLRRETTPTGVVPMDGPNACNNVGFLRYGEFDEERLNGLVVKRDRIQQALSNKGALELRTQLSNALGRIEQEVEKNYPVSGDCQPIHPQMYPKNWIERQQAQHGWDPFASAKNNTWQALNTTGRNLKEAIAAAYRDQITDAPAYLRQYMKAADIGIDLEGDTKQMENILEVAPIGMAEPMMPSLAYNPTGYTVEIDNYLKGVRRYAGAKARHDFAAALLEAYRQVPDHQYTQRRTVMQKEYSDIQKRIGRMMTKKQLLNVVTLGGVLPGSAINVTLAQGRSEYWVLTRDVQMGQECDNAIQGTMARSYYIDPRFGGLKVLDNAPLKALQLLQFACGDAILDNMIG